MFCVARSARIVRLTNDNSGRGGVERRLPSSPVSHVPYYGPDDDFGVPGHMLGCTDDTFRAVGRVAAIAAIIELRMSDIVVQWGRDPNDKGRLMEHLVGRFKQLKTERIKAGLDVPTEWSWPVDAADGAMRDRNSAVHALRPGDEVAWLNRPEGVVDASGLSAMREMIPRLCEAAYALGAFLSTPIEFPEGEFSDCACGCGEATPGTWRPGHQMNAIQARIRRDFGGDTVAFLARIDELSAEGSLIAATA